ncbi:MAG: hypothetical protein NC118_02835 [Eubacterium sp.]|nr:hypothetical protein [Eubacterium sp.]
MSVHLFISHFKQFLKRHYKHFAEVIALILFLLLCEVILEYLLIKDDGNFERFVIYELYQNDENIDNLYLGTSHVFCDINPNILDDINGKNNFNLATSAQPLIASYYLLKEADKENDLECVYLDLNISFLMGDNGNWREPDKLLTSWQVMNSMKFSMNKLDWIIHSTEPRYVYLSLFPSIRYKNNILDFDYLAERLYKKRQEVYLNYNNYEDYIHKGYRYSDHIADELYYEMPISSVKEPRQLSEDAKKYLIKIIEYCNAKDIELKLYANPMSDWILCRGHDYDNYIMQIKEIASEYGLEYYDFNLCKKEYLDISDHVYWSDNNHMNVYGAEIYTNFLGNFFEMLNRGEIESADYFYDSYQQKLDDIEEEIFGVVVEELNGELKSDCLAEAGIQNNGDDCRVFFLSTENNLRNDKVEFYIYLEDKETGEKSYVQDWSENNIYMIPIEIEECRIGIKVRAMKTKQEYGEAIIEYRFENTQ